MLHIMGVFELKKNINSIFFKNDE